MSGTAKPRLERALAWLGRHELGSVIAFATLSAGTLAFLKIASEVAEGDTASLDRRILVALRSPADLAKPIGPAWLEEVARDISALGGIAVLALTTLAVVGYLALIRRPRAAALVGLAASGGAGLAQLLKDAYHRPRPEVVPHLARVISSSFPSGHSMVSTSVYLVLGALLARLEERLVVKAYLLLWALGIATLVGVSRVYLGVHWPTDVLAGWAAGAGWASACWLIARWFQRRGALDRS